MSNPFQVSDIVPPAVYEIVRAISDRGNQTAAQTQERGEQALALILAFLPRDAADLTLAGQTVLFNELTADCAKDVLGGMADTMKLKSYASLVNMGRIVQGNLDRLERRASQPNRRQVVAAHTDEPVVAAVQPAAARPAERAQNAATSQPIVAQVMAAAPATAVPVVAPDPVIESYARKPEPETSWLDEPFEQWLIETPADLAAKAGLIPAPEQAKVAAVPALAAKVPEAPAAEEVAADSATVAEVQAAPATDWADNDIRSDAVRSMLELIEQERALPRQPAEYAPARALADVDAGV